MQTKCDILILTANFGSGHKSVSKAIETYIKEVNSSCNIKIVDMYKIIRPKLYKIIYRLFNVLIKYFAPIYNFDYYKKNRNSKFGELHSCYKSSSKRLARFIDEVQPSIIISTFPTCSAYVSKYKIDNNNNIPLITCITDIVHGSEWVHNGNDMYLVANNSVKNSLVKKGIKEECIKALGIPIRKDFITIKNRNKLRNEYHLEEKDFVILMMGGGLGLIPKEVAFYKWIESNKNIKLFIITGNNNKLYNDINKYNKFSNINILKFTDKVADMMTLSDLLISKPGGITLFEAISCDLPFIIYKPILGQELENCNYIKANKLGLVASNEQELIDKIKLIMCNQNVRNIIIKNLSNEKKNIDMSSIGKNICKYLN
jgi:UDP-N-acetylglucosamine:LPS N-acetylglucosamine transferase